MAESSESQSSPDEQELPNPIHPAFLDRLDKDFIDYYNRHYAIKPASDMITVEEIRAAPSRFTPSWYTNYTYESFVNDLQIPAENAPDVPVRVYDPDPRISSFRAGPYPVYINFHGGGSVFGDLDADGEICMIIRNRVGIKVIDVNYRHCPENTIFQAHDDGWTAIRWIHENAKDLNILPDSISVGGISAGGHMSAVFQQLARDAKLDLRLAIISVAAVRNLLEFSGPDDPKYPSFKENEFAPWLGWARLKYFKDAATPHTEEAKAEIAGRPHWVKNPIDGDLRGVCDTFVITAELDPLRDEAEAYAQKLIKAGVLVTTRRYTGVPHPFMELRTLQKARLYADDICRELKKAHGA